MNFYLPKFRAGLKLAEVYNKTMVTIVYDNTAYLSGTEPAWGFSCFIKGFEKNILFDTGGDGEILMKNMEILGISPQEVETVVISHDHWDHTGGLGAFLKANNKVEVWVLNSFSSFTKDIVKSAGARLVEVDGFGQICKGVYTTGPLGSFIKEQALALETKKGIVVVTGCAHPGVLNIVEFVKKKFDRKIFLVMGGFHLKDTPSAQIESIAEKLLKMGVEHVAPCHCSGAEAQRIFQKIFGQRIFPCGVGAKTDL